MPFRCSPGDGYLQWALLVPQAVLDSGTIVPAMGRDWARLLKATTYPAGFHLLPSDARSGGSHQAWGHSGEQPQAVEWPQAMGYSFCLILPLGTYLARPNLRI